MLNIAAEWRRSAQSHSSVSNKGEKGSRSCRLVFLVARRRALVPGSYSATSSGRSRSGSSPHGLRRCDWRQAGLFPNRDLGSHDLSEQLSLQGRPCSLVHGRARHDFRKHAQKCNREQLWIYRLPKLCKWRYDIKQGVLNLSWCDFQSVFWHVIAYLAIPFHLTLSSNQRKRKWLKKQPHLSVPRDCLKSIQQHICTSQCVVRGDLINNAPIAVTGGNISADSDPCDTPNLGCQSASRPHCLHFRGRSHQSCSLHLATVFSSLLKACARVAAAPGCSSKPPHYSTALSPSLQMGIGEGFNYILFYEKD